MKKVLALFLYAFSAPTTLTVSFLLTAILRLFSLQSLQFRGLMLIGTWKPWVSKPWKWTTTLGHVQLWHEAHKKSMRMELHEQVHTRQWEDDGLRGLVLGLILWALGAPLWAAVFVWWAMPLLILTNFLTAMFRGRHFYQGSEHELSATAQAAQALDE